MSEDTNQEEQWRERFKSVAKAQGRYLWLLLIAGVFYMALDIAVSEQPKPSPQKLPFIGINIDSKVVWASASLVLGFISLATLGTFPAVTNAYSKANPKGDQPFECLDTEPNAIDFIVYAPLGTNTKWTKLGLVTYPLFITLIVAESVWLWYRLWVSKPFLYRTLFLVLGAVMTLACLYPLCSLWKSKITKMLKKESQRAQ